MVTKRKMWMAEECVREVGLSSRKGFAVFTVYVTGYEGLIVVDEWIVRKGLQYILIRFD